VTATQLVLFDSEDAPLAPGRLVRDRAARDRFTEQALAALQLAHPAVFAESAVSA
jgi:hypothetical protein